MSTKRNTKKFRKSLNGKKSTQSFKNKPNYTVFDMGLLDKMVKKYSENISIEYEIKGDKLNLIRKFPTMGDVKIIITKTKKGYSYEDVGMFKRNFIDLDFMIWEFELPTSLKEVILNLPIVDESTQSFISDSMKEELEVMGKEMVELMVDEGIIS